MVHPFPSIRQPRRTPAGHAAKRVGVGAALALMLALASTPGCGSSSQPPGGTAPAVAVPSPEVAASASGTGSLDAVHARLDGLLTGAATCAADSECRTVAVGGKACGGPTGYRAYSIQHADPAAVEALAKQEHELVMAEARASHRISNCLVLADPGARCEQRRCTLGNR